MDLIPFFRGAPGIGKAFSPKGVVDWQAVPEMMKIPTVMTADELIESAFRRATKVQIIGARSKIDKIKQMDMAKINSVSDKVETALRGYVKAFPSLDRMPPFYQEMIGLLVGTDQLKKSLGAVDWCADQVNRIARQYRNGIKMTKVISSMDELRAEMYGRTASLLRQIDKDLRFLNKARDQIKALPTIDPEARTIVIAGAPNVGKSQLVAAISTAKPKVATYPFTTKEITVGVLVVKRVRYQIIDTPGLLDRPLDERNQIERQAIIALRHLADLVVFLLDPTGSCGYPLDYQLSLLEQIKEQYPKSKLIVVENKADLLAGKGENPRVSALTGEGVEELVLQIGTILAASSERNVFSS